MKDRLSHWLNNERHLAYIILIPSLLLLVCFAYFPAVQSLRFSFLR